VVAAFAASTACALPGRGTADDFANFFRGDYATSALVRLLARIVRAGLAIAKPDSVKAGGRTLALGRIVITDAGRRALAGM
jgi:hypothetical protein